jgi:hypothetical protein
MPARIRVTNVAIHKFRHGAGGIEYDGEVVLTATSDGLNFQYQYTFTRMGNVADAIQNAASSLRRDLEALHQETSHLQFDP